jgi:starch synthase
LMSIGNPTDHFNFQEELNKFMDVPPNHPGALVDVGGEHARHEVTALRTSGDLAIVELTRNRLRKTVALSSEPPGLVVCYNGGGRVEMCLSPDYLRLLRAGRRCLLMRRGQRWREVCTDNSSVWVVIPEDEAEWTAPRAPEAGHGVNVAVRPLKHHWHLAIGWGPVEDDIAADLLTTAALVHG